jgi:hypothetical protein
MQPLIKHIKCQNIQLKYLMFAPTCFGPSEPSSGSLRQAMLKLKFCGISNYISLYVEQCCGKKCFKLWCVLCAVQRVTVY